MMVKIYVIMLICVTVYFIFLQTYMTNKVYQFTQTYTQKTFHNEVDSTWKTLNQEPKYCDVFDPSKRYNSTETADYQCVAMQTVPAANICLYTEEGHAASSSVRRTGTWEEEIGENIVTALQHDTSTGFIDFGASIGVHALPVAKAGHPVIAVEPSMSNIMHLTKSLLLNNISNRVTIVSNAVSDHRGTVFAHRRQSSGNPGLQSIVKSHEDMDVVDAYKTILADDLLEVIGFDKAIIKIDIEGAEPLAMSSASLLFSKVNIVAVFMEWDYSRKYYWIDKMDGPSGIYLLKEMIKFFYTHGYKAQDNAHYGSNLFLEYSDAAQWPEDIVWVK